MTVQQNPENNSLDRLRIYALGDFHVRRGEMILSETSRRSSRLWSLFNYLIINRSRSITTEELVEAVWEGSEELSNPEHALRTLIYRLRRVLNGDQSDREEIILFSQGRYRWNSSYTYWFDVEEFQNLCIQGAQSAQSDPGGAQAALEQALALYKGDYLAQFSYTAWVEPHRNYYRRLYVESVYRLIDLLKARRQFSEIISICEKASRVEPFEEGLHLCFMEALLDEGKTGPARAHYSYVTSLFYREMGVKPSPEMRNIYRRLKLDHEAVEMDLNIITDNLKERDRASGAFQCDPEVFRYLYKLEERKLRRTGQSVFLVLFTLTDPNFNLPDQKKLSDGMVLLHDVLTASLRKGDAITRWNEAQYLTLLQGLNFEQAEKVIQRVQHSFQERCEASHIEGVFLRTMPLPVSPLPGV